MVIWNLEPQLTREMIVTPMINEAAYTSVNYVDQISTLLSILNISLILLRFK